MGYGLASGKNPRGLRSNLWQSPHGLLSSLWHTESSEQHVCESSWHTGQQTSAKTHGVAYAQGRVSRERAALAPPPQTSSRRVSQKDGPFIQVKDPPTVKMGSRLQTKLSVLGVKEAEHVAIASSKHKCLYLIPDTHNTCLLCEWKIHMPR